MLAQGIFQLPRRPLKILCLGAHSDDIEIGCGGTILKLLQDHPGSRVVWVVFSAKGDRRQEAIRSARVFLDGAGTKVIIAKSFKESFFPYCGEPIKEFFEKLKETIDPDVIFTHFGQDFHQDHRVVSELTWNTFRKHQVLEYEIPKYDGDLGRPNLYVPLSDRICAKKVRLLIKGFATQRGRQWFAEDTFYSILRLRGIEACTSTRYAEAFYGRKIVVEEIS